MALPPSNPSSSFIVSASGQSAIKYGPSQLLAQLRRTGNNKLCDIELIVEGRKEYVHSAVVAVHSKLFNRLINSEQSPPFSYDLHNLAYDSVKSVLDWMYFGEAKFSSAIASHLAVSAYFEMSDLHHILEQHLVRKSMGPATISVALEACADEKAKVSRPTSGLIVDFLLSSAHSLPPLTTKTAKYLLARDEGNLKRKARVLTLVLKWLSIHRDQAATVLEYTQNVQMNEADERALITALTKMVKNGQNVGLDVDQTGRLAITLVEATPTRGLEQNLVSFAENATPSASEIEINQHMAYSPIESRRREMNKLPDVFNGAERPKERTTTPKKSPVARSATFNKPPATKISSYPPYIERSPGYHPPSYRGHVNLQVQLSTTSMPAFAAYTNARPHARSSNTDTSSIYNNEPITPFTAESIAEMRALPDLFATKSPYSKSAHNVTPRQTPSSVYAQPMHYGPSYAEPAPQYRKSQHESVPLPVQLELPGGAVVIPHAAHPMLPYSQPFVEVRLPNQPAYPTNFCTDYSSSRFKTSEYAGQF